MPSAASGWQVGDAEHRVGERLDEQGVGADCGSRPSRVIADRNADDRPAQRRQLARSAAGTRRRRSRAPSRPGRPAATTVRRVATAPALPEASQQCRLCLLERGDPRRDRGDGRVRRAGVGERAERARSAPVECRGAVDGRGRLRRRAGRRRPVDGERRRCAPSRVEGASATRRAYCRGGPLDGF